MAADLANSPVHWVENRISSGAATATPAAIANVIAGTADGTYAQSPEGDLINDLKTKVDAILAALRSVGIIAT